MYQLKLGLSKQDYLEKNEVHKCQSSIRNYAR